MKRARQDSEIWGATSMPNADDGSAVSPTATCARVWRCCCPVWTLPHTITQRGGSRRKRQKGSESYVTTYGRRRSNSVLTTLVALTGPRLEARVIQLHLRVVEGDGESVEMGIGVNRTRMPWL